MNMNKIIYSALASSLLLLSACGREEQAVAVDSVATVVNAEQIALAQVRSGSLEYKLISRVVSCTGEIEVPPQGLASVTAPLGGYILDLEIVPGMFVRKGALLAKLNNPEYIALQQSYLETAGQLKFAGQEYERQRLLDEQNATAAKKFQESESSLNVLKARLAGLREQLKMVGISVGDLEAGEIQSVVNLRAPISGYVTHVNHHQGQFVEPREVIFELVDTRELHLHLNIFEQDIVDVSRGQNIRFRPAGCKSSDYLGKVVLVSPKKDEDLRTFDVHGHIETGEDKLKPGMFVQAEILVSGDSVYALPQSALITESNKSYVVTDEGGSYKVAEVRTGASMDGWVEIRDAGPLAEKRIVTEGASRLFTALRRQGE